MSRNFYFSPKEELEQLTWELGHLLIYKLNGSLVSIVIFLKCLWLTHKFMSPNFTILLKTSYLIEGFTFNPSNEHSTRSDLKLVD